MATKYKQIYQFKITLKGSKPTIWRRIQVPENYSFWDLHVAIQNAMGWDDSHLHSFTFAKGSAHQGIEIGIPEDDEYLKSTKVKLAAYFIKEKDKATYTYDFGDYWVHQLVLEKILPKAVEQEYPLCLAGKMACPPDDCGGLREYYHMLEVLKDPQDDEYEDTRDWVGEDFDPLHFEPQEVFFEDPKEHFGIADFMEMS